MRSRKLPLSFVRTNVNNTMHEFLTEEWEILECQEQKHS